MKTSIIFALGVVLTVSAFLCMGFTSSTASNEDGVIMIANDGGGAYFYNGKHLFFVTENIANRVQFNQEN